MWYKYPFARRQNPMSIEMQTLPGSSIDMGFCLRAKGYLYHMVQWLVSQHFCFRTSLPVYVGVCLSLFLKGHGTQDCPRGGRNHQGQALRSCSLPTARLQSSKTQAQATHYKGTPSTHYKGTHCDVTPCTYCEHPTWHRLRRGLVR